MYIVGKKKAVIAKRRETKFTKGTIISKLGRMDGLLEENPK